MSYLLTSRNLAIWPDRAKRRCPLDKEFKKTAALPVILAKAEWEVRDTFYVFDQYPIKEVRDTCLKILEDRNFRPGYDFEAGWAESRIRDLLANDEREYWTKLLSWYVCDSAKWLAPRAIEFAICLTKENERKMLFSYLLNDVAKPVASRIKKEPGTYWYVPSIANFIETLLSQLNKNSRSSYLDEHWYNAERAMRMIVATEHVEFLPRLEAIADDLEKNNLWPVKLGAEENFSLVQHRAFVKEVVRVLQAKKKTQFPDLNVLFGSYLRKEAGITGSVIPRLSYLDRVPQDKADLPVKIRLDLALSEPDEEEKLLPVLKVYVLQFEGEGFLALDKERRRLADPQSIEANFQGLSCEFSVLPSKGPNRFWLNLKSKTLGFSTKEVARYLYVE